MFNISIWVFRTLKLVLSSLMFITMSIRVLEQSGLRAETSCHGGREPLWEPGTLT